MTVPQYSTDALIVGGGLGGIAAGLTLSQLGYRVVLTEETDWLGGQLTTQAVPPDEHAWIEAPYSSPSYRRLRNGIRDYYRRYYPTRLSVAADPWFNPGLGLVSKLCHEPRIAVAVIDQMLAPHIASGRLRVLRRHKPIGAAVGGDRIEAVTFENIEHDCIVTLSARYVADATELGDLLELGHVEHVVGAEGRSETGELHAPETADPHDQQAVTWCFALDYRPAESHVIDRPDRYDHWREHIPAFWPGPQLSWVDVEPWSLAPRTRPIFAGDTDAPSQEDLWHYRRILARSQFEPGAIDSDITLVNWPQNDYWERPLVGVTNDDRNRALAESRELSLSLLYWLQTEAPRPDGGTGYPGLRLRPDVTGSDDGLAKGVYVRESRRIRALFTVTEQHVGADARGPGAGSEIFADSVGLGSYRIDLHPSTAGRSYVDVDCFPFQIPLGALIPVRVTNLLAANKNIGTTHITNGAYRLHPVEWSIGEAVGALISYCLHTRLPPERIWRDQENRSEYQRLLATSLGISLTWPDYIRRMTTEDAKVRACPEIDVSDSVGSVRLPTGGHRT